MNLLNEGRIGDRGCLMLQFPKNINTLLVNFGKKLLPDDTLFTDPDDDSFGRESEYHTTIKYSYVENLTKEQIAKIIGSTKPFFITLTGISQFKNEKFDVLKFDVLLDDKLKELRDRANQYPNDDKYNDNFHPHSTIGYTLKNKIDINKSDLDIKIPIKQFKYSGIGGIKYWFNLK